ncbi:MAG: NAD(P)H-dependent oxidoreductase [Lentilactobacillus diolivorans]|jgi:NAD(P)H-dependent FMN reductase|uniref:NADPH-dependent FMN reductase n=1 Tax=Lentilactobacillus diolivorans TaxID=179838 RepID=UPI000FEF3C2B|nr:NAD(P)H-dependent oxidoreductase [Lentilactobacillus diolivorans]MCH4165907.1 NAD(P)H-dependent oxidoreductase [Lentilactobacillus diolivorans]MDH5106892.1 NAD(P)H-dependent oxidoreductase [Lentilactobacillus diolivorans]RRG02403.1 MAG: NAD(P)H-dependent oxidoreductase [Lactobacillus sp.]
MVTIGIVLGSVRTGSLGDSIFNYLQKTYQNSDSVKYNWIRVADYPLDPYQHDETPLSYRIKNLKPNEDKWLKALAACDGYIIMTPEYDHAIPGVLKNALDYVGPEVDRKPVQIVTYSYYSDGGMLAAESFVEILQMLKMMVLPTPVLLWNATDNFKADGTLIADATNSDHFKQRLDEAFNEIGFYTKLLKDHPFPG